MPIVNLGHNPTLTKEKAMEILRKHLKYEITTSGIRGDWFLVVKSGAIGAAVKVMQRQTSTQIDVRYYMPNRALGLVFILLLYLPYIIISLGPGPRFAKEISQFITACPDFKVQG